MTDSIVFVNGKSKCGCEMKFNSGHGEYSDVHRITPCPIHAAASAQAPFIFGIADPDGGAYIEEMCVSSSASNLEEEVACLNTDVVAGDPLYEVVPLYRKAAPSIPAALPDEITQSNAPEVHEIVEGVCRLGLQGTYGVYAFGWNACRAAMLAAEPKGGVE